MPASASPPTPAFVHAWRPMALPGSRYLWARQLPRSRSSRGRGIPIWLLFLSGISLSSFDPRDDFFAKQRRIFLGGNRASRDPGRRNGGVMRNPNYTYADTRQPSPDDEGQQESPHLSI